MRFNGNLASWNDERGFGFITPARGGQQIFVHIKAFERAGSRPRVGLPVSFEVELGSGGKKRAKRVQVIRPARAVKSMPGKAPAAWGTASYFSIVLFMLVYLGAAITWRVPSWVAGWYAAASLVCYVVYAIDKRAAVAGRRRISEAALLLWGLVGGWPGAIVAQQVLRHKSVKAKFRAGFWVSVVANVVLFLVLSSPLAPVFFA